MPHRVNHFLAFLWLTNFMSLVLLTAFIITGIGLIAAATSAHGQQRRVFVRINR